MMAGQVGTSGQLFPTGVVGSLPRPQFLRDLLDPRAEGHTPPDVHARRLDAATQYIITMQEAAGLDLISDGEWRRRSYFGVIAEIMHGFAAYVVDDELGQARPFHTVVEPMTPRRLGRICGGVPLSRPAYRPDDESLSAIAVPTGTTAVGGRSGRAAPTPHGKRSCRRWYRFSGTSLRPLPGPV